jgi:hypothetical protein
MLNWGHKGCGRVATLTHHMGMLPGVTGRMKPMLSI